MNSKLNEEIEARLNDLDWDKNIAEAVLDKQIQVKKRIWYSISSVSLLFLFILSSYVYLEMDQENNLSSEIFNNDLVINDMYNLLR
jgi:hypothetical protein